MGALDRYLEKRDFDQTPEPWEADAPPGLALRYSMQKHDATRLHWDLRLEWEGVLLSWAVTKGPSLDPKEKRLAVRTEDHPVSYLDFEGTIPKGNYGAGTVMLWDIGHWQPLIPVDHGLRKGHLHLALHGRRMTGRWNLIRMKGRRASDKGRENWLMIKEEDEAAHEPDPVERHMISVYTGRDIAQIAAGAPLQPVRRRSKTPPRFRKPQLATLTEGLRADDARWHELKFDGYRALVAIGKGGARIYTRNGHDWSDKFAALIPAFEDLPCETALIDGEIVAGAGLQGFGTLQKAIKAGGPFTFYGFDLLSRDGSDLAGAPLTERRAALEALVEEAPPMGLIQLSPVIRGDAAHAFETVCAAGGEGLISKRMDAPYRGGRSTQWLKIKCERRAEFVVTGWQKSDKRGRPFASLAVATYEAGKLVYRGKVGTGFDGETMEELAAAMGPLARKTPPHDVDRAEARGVQWIAPQLVAEIKYAEITDDGRLRHPVFEGLRADKPARDVQMDRPAEEIRMSESRDREEVAGVGVSSGDRVVYPKAKVTKLRVAEYYEAAAERILEEAADRPLSLVRLPEGLEGQRFFQKHAGKGWPAALRRVAIAESDGKTADYMYVTDAEGLVAAAQMGTIEFHIWGSRRDRLERPDRMVFDLDPDEGLKFADVRSAAVDLRDRLADLDLPSWPLLSGGKGVHVVVPLRRVAGWETVKLFSKAFSTICAEDEPGRYVATMSKAKRKGRIFIDWLRNERGSTAIAPFSLRARPGAPVAVPVSWDELRTIRRADAFDIKKALERGWDALEKPAPRGLTEAVVEKLARR